MRAKQQKIQKSKGCIQRYSPFLYFYFVDFIAFCAAFWGQIMVTCKRTIMIHTCYNPGSGFRCVRSNREPIHDTFSAVAFDHRKSN